MKGILIITILAIALFTGCAAGDPAYVSVVDETPIDINIEEVADDAAIQTLGATGGDTYQVPIVDSTTHAFATIDVVHHEIHEGSHYYVEGFTTLAEDLGGGEGTLYVKLVTPDNTKWAHLTWQIISSGILETNFYEGASGGMAGGANITALNNNRNSTNTSGLVITFDVSVATNKGLKVSSKKVGGTGFKTVSGGVVDRTDELILKQNTIYFREFISGSADNVISFRASWYEHTNKEP